jgi:hypothetical protein
METQENDDDEVVPKTPTTPTSPKTPKTPTPPPSPEVPQATPGAAKKLSDPPLEAGGATVGSSSSSDTEGTLFFYVCLFAEQTEQLDDADDADDKKTGTSEKETLKTEDDPAEISEADVEPDPPSIPESVGEDVWTLWSWTIVEDPRSTSRKTHKIRAGPSYYVQWPGVVDRQERVLMGFVRRPSGMDWAALLRPNDRPAIEGAQFDHPVLLVAAHRLVSAFACVLVHLWF